MYRVVCKQTLINNVNILYKNDKDNVENSKIDSRILNII